MRRHRLLVIVGAILAAFVLAYVLSEEVRRGLSDVPGALLWALQNPYVFFPLLFVYSILIAVILPIPIEPILLGLPFADPLFILGAAVTVGLGKAVGGWLVFVIGVNFEEFLAKWSRRIRWFGKFIALCERFVKRTGYVGLFILLSVPMMSDTAVLYIFSMFNPTGKKGGTAVPDAPEPRHALRMVPFVITNFLGGMTRVGIAVLLIWLGLAAFVR